MWICAFCWISEFLHFLLSPLPPKNKWEIYSREEIHFLSLALTFEENYRSKDLILDNFVLWVFFVYSHLLCVQDELKGIVMDSCCAYWMLAIPFRSYPALLWEGCWSLRNYGRCRVELRSTLVVSPPSPASSGSSSCVKEAQLPKTFTTPHTGCCYSMKLIFGDVVVMPRILRCSAAQSEVLSSLARAAKHLDILDKHKCINPRQHLWAEKDIFLRQTAALNEMHGLCCLWKEFAVGCPKLQTNCARTACLCCTLASGMLDRAIELIILPMMQIWVHIQFCLGSFRQKQPWLASIYLSKLLRQLASFYQHQACQGIAINLLAGGIFLSFRRKGVVVVSSCPAALQREKINKETR